MYCSARNQASLLTASETLGKAFYLNRPLRGTEVIAGLQPESCSVLAHIY